MNEHSSWRLFVLSCWLMMALALAVRTVVSPDRHTVFPVLAASSGRFWNDRPLYGNYKPLDYFRYPPVFAVAVTPLASLGLRLGGILWAWLNLAIYGAGVYRMLRDLLPVRDWSEGRRAFFLLLALLGAVRGLWNGQSNALAVGLLLLGTAELACRRPWRAAFYLSGAIALKLTPMAVVLLLAGVFPRRLLLRVPAALAAIVVVPFLLGPPAMVWRHHEEWVCHLASSSSERWPGFRDAWTLYQAGLQLVGLAPGPLAMEEPLASPWYRGVQLLAAGAALGWCLLRKLRCSSTTSLLEHLPEAERGRIKPLSVSATGRGGFLPSHLRETRRSYSSDPTVLLTTLAMGLGWLMLFGPAVESASFAFLGPVLSWAVVEPAGGLRRMLAFISALLILVLGWSAVNGLLRPTFPAVVSALPLGTCLFVGWLITARRVDSSRCDKPIDSLGLPSTAGKNCISLATLPFLRRDERLASHLRRARQPKEYHEEPSAHP